MSCPPHNPQARVRRKLAGVCVIQQQCQDCLRSVGGAQAINQQLIQGMRWWEHRKRPTRRRQDYQAFMRSTQWRQLSKDCLVRDGYVCQGCSGEASEAHHVRYRDTLEETLLEDLAAACSSCNQEARTHGIQA